MSVHPNLYHLIAISTLTFCVLTLSTNVAQGQGFTSDADGLFNIRGIQETGGGSDTQFNSTTEVLNIWNAIDGGATVPGTVSANSQTYDIGDFEVDKETVVNYNGGDFGGNLSYATINSDGAPGGAGGSIGTGAGGTEDFSVRADASVAIPVGTWSIAISSDDGRYLVLTGANFTATGGEDAPDLGGVGMDFFGFDGTSGHDSTIGVFTVAPSDTVKGGSGGSIDSGLAIRTLDAFFFERGGGDSVEIAIKSGSDTSGAASPGDGWTLLQDGALGWQVSSNTINFTFAAAGPERHWDYLATPTGNWTDTNWDDANPPTGANTGDFPTGGLSGNEAFVSGGQVNVTSSEGAFSLDIGNAFPGGMAVVAVQTGGTLSIQDSINIGVPGDLLIDGGTVNSFLINSTGQVIINNGGTLNADGALGTLEGPLNSVATINGNLTATQFNNYGGTLTLGTGSFTAASVILQNGGSGDPTFDVASGATMTLQNVVNGIGAGNFTKDGNGILNLDTANTYTGVTNIDDGTVSISNANSLGPNGSANTIVASGASLRLTGGSFNVNEAITINGGGNGDSDGALHSQGSNHDINGLITLGSGATIRKDGGGDLEIRGGIDTAGNQLRFENDDTVRVLGGGSVISGTGSVVKENNGTLELQNDNSYSGTTTINDGVVDIRTDMGLGTTAGNTNIDGDATLRLRGNLNSAENITLNGTANSGNGQNEGRIRNDDGDNILSGSIGWNDNSRVDVDSGTSLTLSGMVSGGGNIDKADTGRLAFSNPLNDFTGNVNVGAGTVAGSGNGSLGLANSITVANDATLEVGNVGTVASSLNVMGDGQAGVGVINNVAGDATFSGPVAAQGTSTTINGAANTNTTFTGAISLGVATDLTFNGDGNVTISQAFGNGAGPAELNALNAQFYDINGGDAQLNFQGTYSLNSNGTLTGVGGDLANTIDATSVQDFGPINYDRPGGSTSASGSDPYTFEALFSSLSGDPQEFQVVWVGEFVPDASGDYTFRTGDENLGGNPDDNGSIYVDLNQNGTFDSGEGTQSGSGIDVALTGFVAGERYTIAIGFNENGGDERFSASIQGSNGGSFTSETLIDPSSQSVFKATFDVDNNLIKNGSGLLRLDGDNTYNGTTEVNAGTLVINGDTSGQGSFNIDSGATLGGNGTIGLAAGESVNISGSPGTISPGDAGAGYAGPDPTFSMGTDAATVGTLTVDSTDPLFDPSSNSINLDGILQLDIVDPTTADMLVALQGIIDIDETTAMLNINGETDFSNLDFDAEMEDLFLVTSVDGINGNFNNTPLMDGAFEFSDIDGDSFALQFDGNNIILAAIAVPEPSTILIWTLLGLAAGGFAVRQRRRK